MESAENEARAMVEAEFEEYMKSRPSPYPQHVLVIFDGNWADEMDIEGFQIKEKGSWLEYVDSLPDKPFREYIGSNQDMEFLGKKDYLSNIKVKELTHEEYLVLKKFFPYGFGEFIEPDIDEEEG